MRRLGMIVCLAAACGGSSPERGPGADAGMPGASNVVTVTTGNGEIPDLVAYRSGSDGAWLTPDRIAADVPTYTLTLEVGVDDYLVLTACDDGGSGSAFSAFEFGFTRSGDGSAVNAECIQTGAAAGVSGGSSAVVTITGTMTEPGSVQIGGVTVTSATAPWTYRIATTPGVHDVLAIDSSDRVVFDEGLTFAGATADGPAIDTSAAATLLTEPLTISGLGSDSLLVNDVLGATDEMVVARGSDPVARTMPLSDLGSGDSQSLEVFAFDADGGFRAAYAYSDGAVSPPASYALLPTFSTASVDGVTMSWASLPDPANVTLVYTILRSPTFQILTVEASSSWLAARHASSLTFDQTASGYSPAWNIDPATATAYLTEDTLDPTTGIGYQVQTVVTASD